MFVVSNAAFSLVRILNIFALVAIEQFSMPK